MVEVKLDGGIIREISGNLCDKGEEYVRKEILNPERGVTSTVKVVDGVLKLVSVRTSWDTPKDKIMEVMDEISDVAVNAPVRVGDIIVRDVANTGADIVATRNVDRR